MKKIFIILIFYLFSTNILIADDPEEFADAVIKLIQNIDFSKIIKNNLYELIKMNYSLENLENEIKNIFDYLAKK